MTGALLLLMTTRSYRAGAFLDAARRIGRPVVVGTDRPQALAFAHPEGHLALDFLATGEALAMIERHAASHPIAAVVAAEDEGSLLAARAAERLGLAHHPPEAVEIAGDKARTRAAFSGAGLPGPGFRTVAVDEDPERLAAEVAFPCVVKPLFLSGSRGVIRADDGPSFVSAFRRVAGILSGAEVLLRGGAAARRVLIEDYLPGDEVAVEGLVTRGHLRVLAVFDKPDRLEGPTFEETLYVTPSRRQDQDAIAAAVHRGAVVLGLSHGPIHAEVRITSGTAWVVEIAPRSIGGLCSRSLRFGAGVPLEELMLRHALGEDVTALEREAKASGVMMIPIPKAGVLERVEGLEAARGVAGIDDVRITIPAGQELVPLPEGARYLGFLFARAATPERVEAALREAHRCLQFVITSNGAAMAAPEPEEHPWSRSPRSPAPRSSS